MTRTRNLLLLIFAVMTFSPSVAAAATTPLHDASQSGKVAEVKRLLSAGADIKEKDNDGWTPLHMASRSGHVKAVKILKTAGGKE